jgi:oligosaccharide repeat unit polymerase
MVLVASARKLLSPVGIFALLIVIVSQIPNTGSRAFQVPALLSIVVLRYALRGKRPSTRTLLVGALVLFLLGIELPRFYRDSLDLGASLTSIGTSAVSNPQSLLSDFATGADTAMIDDLSAELNVVPDVLPWQWGQTYLNAAVQWVPRQLWDAKPHVADNDLVHTIDPIDYPPDTTAGFSFSVIGEPYLNFGIAGVIAVLVLFGGFWRVFYEWFRRDPSNRSVATIYALSWPWLLVYMRGSIGADYYRQLLAVVPALFIILLVQNRKRADKSLEPANPSVRPLPQPRSYGPASSAAGKAR